MPPQWDRLGPSSGLTTTRPRPATLNRPPPTSRRSRSINGEAHRLGFPTGSFDAVHTDRVLQHPHDPGAVVNQLARLLRPGGVVVFAEPDWATLVVDQPNPTLVRAYRRYVVEHQVRKLPHR